MKKLPKELNINIFEIIDNDLNDELFTIIRNFLGNQYGQNVDWFEIKKDTIKVVIGWKKD